MTTPLWPNNDRQADLFKNSYADSTECTERALIALLLEAMGFAYNEENAGLSSTHVKDFAHHSPVNLFFPTRRADVFVISIFQMNKLEKEQPSRFDTTETDRLNWFLKKSKQRIWYTGIIVVWTSAIYICPEWMSKVPTPPHHPGNLCYHLLRWTICWCYYRWWSRMCCLINEMHIGPRIPAWTRRTGRLGMVTDINYVHFYVKFIQSSPVYLFHQSIKVFRYLW